MWRLLSLCHVGIWITMAHAATWETCDFSGEPAMLSNVFGHDGFSPAVTCYEDKFLLAENPNESEQCRFRLEATLHENNQGDTVLADVLFYFGKTMMMTIVKIGKSLNATRIQYPGEPVQLVEEYPFSQTYDEIPIMITVDGSDVFVSSSICNWTLQYNIDVPEGIIFKDYAGVASGHVGACYEQPRLHCYYGKNYRQTDEDADLIKFCDAVVSPFYSKSAEAITLAENLGDSNAACRFRLEAILREHRGITRLRSAWFCYGADIENCFEIRTNKVKFYQNGKLAEVLDEDFETSDGTLFQQIACTYRLSRPGCAWRLAYTTPACAHSYKWDWIDFSVKSLPDVKSGVCDCDRCSVII